MQMQNPVIKPQAASPGNRGASGFRVLRRGAKRWLLTLLALGSLLAIMVASLPFLVLLGGYGYYQVTGRIAPGARVGETRLDWMTVSDAAVRLEAEWNTGRSLLVTDGLHSWQLSPMELGLRLDSIQTAQNAFGVGRRQTMLSEIRQTAQGWLGGNQVTPAAVLDTEKARQSLSALNVQASLPARDAALEWDGQRFVVEPARMGYAIDVEASLRLLAENPGLALASGYLRLPLTPVLPQVNDVSSTLGQAQHLVDTPQKLIAYDPITDETLSWDVPREEIGSWLRIEPAPEGDGDADLKVGFDPAKVSAYLETLSASLDGERWLDGAKYADSLAQAIAEGKPLSISVSHHPTRYTVKSGDTLISIGWKVGMPYWMILQANPGMDPDNLRAGESLVIPSKDELLPLPVVANKRVVISISEQRLHVYQDGQQISRHLISTGIDRSPTQPGVFQVRTHEEEAYASVWDLYMPNFLGIYEAWPGFMNGIHGLPTLSNGRRLWANILGRPASYGCIILDLEAAEALYDWAEEGVVVEIRP